MPSYIIINYDTTAPIINIHAPKYTTKELTNNITIESNETLSDYQEIYVIDSYGVRHDYTFERRNNQYVGYVRFSDFPHGIVTVYARVADSVGNLSNIKSATIEIKESLSILKLNISDRDARLVTREISNKQSVNSVIAKIKIRDIDINK